MDWAAGRVTGQVPGLGDHILLESQVDDGRPIYAMGWNDKNIVSTCGTTVAGLPSRCPRHRKVFRDGEWVTEVYFKEVKRPHMIADFFFNNSASLMCTTTIAKDLRS